jgi:hypothetical protein
VAVANHLEVGAGRIFHRTTQTGAGHTHNIRLSFREKQSQFSNEQVIFETSLYAKRGFACHKRLLGLS